METRARLQNTLALLHRRRQRPRGGDDVRIGEVLEQEIPVPRVHVVEGFEAARDEARRHCGGNLIVERDLLAARVPRAAGSVGVPGLEDDGARSAGSSGLVRQAQPENAREHRGAFALHHDIADTTISERAGTAQRVGEMLGAGRSRQGFRRHGGPSGQSTRTTSGAGRLSANPAGTLARRLTERVAPGEGGAGH